MADDKKTVYIQITAKWWWVLRTQFKRALPTTDVSDTYLTTVLGISTSSAKGVAIPQFKLMGIINQDGTINDDRARAWRDDEQYTQVCQAIVKERYPQELLDTFPNPSEGDRNSITAWFARTTGVGMRAARAMTSFYLMLNEADASKAPDIKKRMPARPSRKVEPVSKTKADTQPKIGIVDEKKQSSEQREDVGIPSININVQVHISSDASAEQIDTIFSSMAKHLNIRRSNIDG